METLFIHCNQTQFNVLSELLAKLDSEAAVNFNDFSEIIIICIACLLDASG